MRFDLAAKTTCPGQKADEVYARMLKTGGRAPARCCATPKAPGPVPLGHPAQQLPLRRRAPGLHCRQRPRRGLQHALGLWHEAGPVRAVAGSRLARKSARWSRKTSTLANPVQRAAARGCLKGPVADAGGVHHPPVRSTRPRASSCPPQPAGVPAPALPETVLGERRSAANRWHHGVRDESIRLWTLDGRCSIASIKTKMHAIGPG